MKKDITSRMRQRITFQTESLSADSAGGAVISWISGDTVWAEVKPVSSRSVNFEKFEGGKLQGSATHIITTRYISGITQKMRILYDSRTFNIRSVVNLDERNEFLQIVAEEGVGE